MSETPTSYDHWHFVNFCTAQIESPTGKRDMADLLRAYTLLYPDLTRPLFQDFMANGNKFAALNRSLNDHLHQLQRPVPAPSPERYDHHRDHEPLTWLERYEQESAPSRGREHD